jgi:hypothetical protein
MRKRYAFDITPDLVAQARGLRAQGKTLGDIAHAIDWPALRSLAGLQQIVGDKPLRGVGEVAPRGPVYRATASNRP